jgi:N utilization substance protein A
MKYDTQLIKQITVFEQQTGARVKDALRWKEKLTFIVEPGDMGKALGRNKQNVYKLQDMFGEDIKIVEFDTNRLQFIQNFLKPLTLENIEEDGDIITIYGGDERTNGIVIGRKASNLRALEDVVNHYFDVEEIKVK